MYLRSVSFYLVLAARILRKEHDGKLGDEDDCVVVDDALRAPAGPQGQEQVGRQE
jgi:hypothetical protein